MGYSMECGVGCQRFVLRGSLCSGMSTKANLVRMVVAIFTMAVFYASVCSTTCAIGFCPNQVQHTAGHACDQRRSHHSDQSKHQTPDNPDCSQHQHPGLFITKSGDLAQFQFSIMDHPNVLAASFFSLHSLVMGFTHLEASDHTPPPASSVPLYQQISILRI